MREMIANLLNMKAECEKEFTEEEAAYDLAINSGDLSYRALAKRWGWSKSTIARTMRLLNLAAKGAEAEMIEHQETKELVEVAWDSVGTKQAETEPYEHVLGQIGTDWDNLEEVQKEGFPPNNPLSKKNIPLLKKNPPKGGQKEIISPLRQNPQNGSETQVWQDLGSNDPVQTEKTVQKPSAPPAAARPETAAKPPQAPEIGPPCLEQQAERYFAQRLEKDPEAVKKGYQAAILAQSFWWHWDAKDWIDKAGKIITSSTWKSRAATWYRQKDKYRDNRFVQQQVGKFYTPSTSTTFV